MLAVGIDKARAVFGDAEHPLGPIGAGVAFDGVQGQLQTAGAFEKAHALVEQVVDLVPAFQGGLCTGAVVEGRVQDGGPAGAVRLDLAQRGFGWVGPGRPAGIAPGGFPRPARRTRRACLHAPGAPRVLPVGQPPVVATAGFGVHGVGMLLPR